MYYSDLSNNQIKLSIDLQQTYEAYRDARRKFDRYAGGMTWKTVNGQDYLIKIINRRGAMKSLGPRSDETAALHAEFVAGKARAKEREAGLVRAVKEFAGMARSLRINRAPSIVTATLRRLDEFKLLGRNLMVVGTNALYAYEAVAGVQFDVDLMATTDVDLLWDARTTLKLAALDSDVAEAGVLAILRKVDGSFEPVSNKGFRAVNKDGFFVDIIKQSPVPPRKTGEPARIADGDLTPAELPHIQWLLASEKFKAVVIGQDGQPAPMVCPDPRAFAVYKHWLSEQVDREPGKRQRDRLQAEAVIALVRDRFPHLPLDANAERMFPAHVRTLAHDKRYEL